MTYQELLQKKWSLQELRKALWDHVENLIDQAGGIDTLEGREIAEIYMASQDNDIEKLHELLDLEE